jgi:hypothetical protein
MGSGTELIEHLHIHPEDLDTTDYVLNYPNPFPFSLLTLLCVCVFVCCVCVRACVRGTCVPFHCRLCYTLTFREGYIQQTPPCSGSEFY